MAISFPTTPILDDFQRPNEGPPPSANWTNDGAAAPWDGMVVISNTVRRDPVKLTNQAVAYWSTVYGPDCEAHVKIGAVAPGHSERIFLGLRLLTTAHDTMTGYRLDLTPWSGNWLLYRDGPPASSGIGNGALPAPLVAGDGVGLAACGDDIIFWYFTPALGWIPEYAVSDSTYNQAGYLLIGEYSTNGFLKALDDFGGGDKLDCPIIVRRGVMSYESWLTEGVAAKNQEFTVYLKKYDTFDPFAWGGKCMRIEDSTETLGGMTATTRQSTFGGLERDGILMGAPGETTFALAMKELQADRKKADLKRCLWIADRRKHCGSLSAWNAWLEITRHCIAKASDRGITGSGFSGDEEEAMVTLSMAALETSDIWRISSTVFTPEEACGILDVAVCQPERCPGCDPQEDCVVVACSEQVSLGTPYLYTNLHGGDPDDWTAISLADWSVATPEDANGVYGHGAFVCVVSNGAGAIIYSDDLGVTQVEVTETDWATNGPNDITGLDQSLLIVVCDAGHIWISYDAARTWEEADDGQATDQNLTEVQIAPDNPLVVYASGAANALVKSENGGASWFALTGPCAADAITMLDVKSQYRLLIGNDDGEIWESSDGGESWEQQNPPPGLPATTSMVNDAIGCGCDVQFLVVEDTTADAHVIYRSVDGGANGRWYEPVNVATPGDPPTCIACCGPNRAIVGTNKSDGVDGDLILLS